MTTTTEQATYLDCTEVAALIRADIKAAFPGVKFSVTTSRYSGGSSVRIGWTDGPLTSAVDAAIARYDCQGFDGMTDSTTNRGPTRLADGRLVRIHSWISTSRKVSDALRARVADYLTRHPWLLERDDVHSVSWRACVSGAALIVAKR